MKIWYYAPPGTQETIDATSSRAALGIYMAIGTALVTLAMAIGAFAIWGYTGRELKIDESVLKFIYAWLGFVLTFNGFAIGAGILKSHAAPKVAEAEVKRAEAVVQKAVAAKLNGTTTPAASEEDGRTSPAIDPARGLDDDGNPI